MDGKKYFANLLVSMLLAFIGLFVVLKVEDWARYNESFLLYGTLSTFVFVILSFYFLIKGNVERIKSKIVLSLFASLFLIAVFIMNGIIFIVYFIGK